MCKSTCIHAVNSFRLVVSVILFIDQLYNYFYSIFNVEVSQRCEINFYQYVKVRAIIYSLIHVIAVAIGYITVVKFVYFGKTFVCK